MKANNLLEKTHYYNGQNVKAAMIAWALISTILSPDGMMVSPLCR